MKENKGTMESVTLGRVPDSERKNWWTVALIQAGIMISMLMEENQLKEMLRFSNELEQKSWLLPHTQEELEIAINRGMEDVKAGRIVSHEDVLKYYMK